MGERRMFTNKIIEADEFTSLPPTTQCLYFHLCMTADDDGFSNKVRQALFNAHAVADDFNVLVQKRFIIPFESGVVVIKHWRMHNLIRSDRYHETSYLEEKSMLILKDNGVYTEHGNQVTTSRQPDDVKMEPEVSIGKVSIGNIPPLPPTGERWNKRTNVENLIEYLNSGEYQSTQTFKDHPELYQSVKEWMAYKDARKPRTNNHYANETSMKTFLNKVVANAEKIGTEAMIEVINESMGNNYQGIVWEKCERKLMKKTGKTKFHNFEERDKADYYDQLEKQMLGIDG